MPARCLPYLAYIAYDPTTYRQFGMFVLVDVYYVDPVGSGRNPKRERAAVRLRAPPIRRRCDEGPLITRY